MDLIRELEKLLLEKGRVRIELLLDELKKKFGGELKVEDVKNAAQKLDELFLKEGHPIRVLIGKRYVELVVEGSGKPQKLPASCYEVLAVLAMYGNLTRSEIEKIRGVTSAKPIARLLELGLIEVKGKVEGITKDYYIYGLSDEFLKEMGFLNWKEFEEFRGAIDDELGKSLSGDEGVDGSKDGKD